MKWLILLLIISCGKQEPQAVNLQDSDGDQTPDYLEAGASKYIADYIVLEKISGAMKFTTSQKHEIEFSNNSDLKAEAIKLIIGDIKYSNKDQYFSEWSEVRLKSPTENIVLQANMTTVHLHFGPTKIEPDELILIQGKVIKRLGKWESYMRLNLTKEEMQSILSGTSSFAFRKKFLQANFLNETSEKTIREKTIKVLTHKDSESKVFYVSKSLSHQERMDVLEIQKAQELTDEELFFNSNDESGKQWFYRKYQNGDMAFIFSTIQDLKNKFRDRFKIKRADVRRENGHAVNFLSLENKGLSKIFLKIRPTKFVRTFSESSFRSQHERRRHDDSDVWECHYFTREIAAEKKVRPEINEFFSSLAINFEWYQDIKILEQEDEKGYFWEMMLTPKAVNLKLSLLSRPVSTFTTTGFYDAKCQSHGYGAPGRGPSYSTNDEGKLNFDIESFVEKSE